jgi:hypothetical protein
MKKKQVKKKRKCLFCSRSADGYRREKWWAIVYYIDKKEEIAGFQHALIFRTESQAKEEYKNSTYTKIDKRDDYYPKKSGWKIKSVLIEIK